MQINTGIYNYTYNLFYVFIISILNIYQDTIEIRSYWITIKSKLKKYVWWTRIRIILYFKGIVYQILWLVFLMFSENHVFLQDIFFMSQLFVESEQKKIVNRICLRIIVYIYNTISHKQFFSGKHLLIFTHFLSLLLIVIFFKFSNILKLYIAVTWGKDLRRFTSAYIHVYDNFKLWSLLYLYTKLSI